MDDRDLMRYFVSRVEEEFGNLEEIRVCDLERVIKGKAD